MKTSLIYYFKILILSLVVSFPLIIPFFHSGYFPTHDGEWAVVRLADMYREIKVFEIPARFSGYLNFQYGYPLFNFEYPMPYYIGVTFVFLKLGLVNSIKLLFASSVVLSFFSMFILSKSIWKSNWAGFISGIFYIYVPYRIVDLYVRGSLGESLSFVLFPLILLGIKKLYENKNKLSILSVGFLYGLLITTHNIMAVLFGIVILFIILGALIKKNFEFIIRLFLSLVYALLISAFFWIPALFEKNLILLSKVPIADRSLYFVKFSDLIIPKWGYGTPTDSNGFGYQIGIPQILAFILVLILVLIRFKNKETKLALSILISTVAIILLMFPQFSFVWSHTPLLSEINYPWTILSLIILLTSLLTGFLVKQGKVFVVVGIALAVLAIIIITPHARPQTFVDRGNSFYLTNQGTTTSSNELMPLWVKKQPKQQPNRQIENLNGQELIQVKSTTSNKIVFSTLLSAQRIIQVNLIYYPGWIAYVNGVESKINYSNSGGVMRLTLDKGENNVRLIFKETPLRLFSDLVTLTSLFGAIAIYYLYRKKLKT